MTASDSTRSHFTLLSTEAFAAYSSSPHTELREADCVVMYFHGGGYGLGDPLQNWDLYQRWTREAEVRGIRLAVVAVKYRTSRLRTLILDTKADKKPALGAANPYPAALDAALAAYDYMTSSLGVNSRSVFLAGDSAGAHLTACLELAIRDSQRRPPAGAILLSPWLDLTLLEASKSPYLGKDPMVSPTFMRQVLVPNLTGGKYDAHDRKISPCLVEHVKGISPQLVIYGDCETLQEDAKAWIRLCHGSGVNVNVHVGRNGLHSYPTGGLLCGRSLEEASDAAVLGFITSLLSPS